MYMSTQDKCDLAHAMYVEALLLILAKEQVSASFAPALSLIALDGVVPRRDVLHNHGLWRSEYADFVTEQACHVVHLDSACSISYLVRTINAYFVSEGMRCVALDKYAQANNKELIYCLIEVGAY